MRTEYFSSRIKSLVMQGKLEDSQELLKKIEQKVIANPRLIPLKERLQFEKIITDLQNISNKNKEGLNILYGTMEIAGQLKLYSKTLSNLGMLTRVLNYYPSYLEYTCDYVYDINSNFDYQKSRNIDKITEESIEKFDVFHYMFNSTLKPDYSDLPLLKEAGKSVFMHNVGSEVRLATMASKLGWRSQVKYLDEEQLKRNISSIAEFVDHCIVLDAELNEYVKSYYNNVSVIPASVDIDDYSPREEFEFKKRKPVVVHAPTSPIIKGTEYILKAIEELKDEIDFEFILVKNTSHEKAVKIYRESDIIIDQLNAGSYGVLSIEGMALGKPVICYISDFMKENYPSDLPIYSSNSENIKESIRYLLKNYDARKELGEKGRNYVINNHDSKKNAKKLLDLYIH
ncbi:glycosyltransferase [Cytobacillus firmus]|uniref:glycosyltransferase n=1 Tax=Cytobacillus firmus TaxID=1399 RepID=UPI00367DB2E5